MSDTEMQEPGTPASNISREPEDVEEMLRISEDEGEGDKRAATEREPVGAEPPGDNTGSGAGSGSSQPNRWSSSRQEMTPRHPELRKAKKIRHCHCLKLKKRLWI
jgi:hypothetical protein